MSNIKNMFNGLINRTSYLLDLIGDENRENFDFQFSDVDFNDDGHQLANRIIDFKKKMPYSRNWDKYFGEYIINYLESDKCTFSDFLTMDQILLSISDDYLEKNDCDNKYNDLFYYRKLLSVSACSNAFASIRKTNYSYLNCAHFAKRFADIISKNNTWLEYVEMNYSLAIERADIGKESRIYIINLYYELLKIYSSFGINDKAILWFDEMFEKDMKYLKTNEYSLPVGVKEEYFFSKILLQLTVLVKKLGVDRNKYMVYVCEALEKQKKLFDIIEVDTNTKSCIFKSGDYNNYCITFEEAGLYIEECREMYEKLIENESEMFEKDVLC